MKRISIIGLCLMAAMAVSAVAVASSSALPEFKTASTKFPVTFTSVNKTGLEPTLHSSILESVINCKTTKDSGEVLTATTVGNITVLYTGCKEGTSAEACTSPGEPTGDIVTKNLKGRIGYVPGTLTTTKLVGTELEATTGNVFAEFTCTGAAGKTTVEGCTIGEAKPTNISQKTGSLLFEEVNKGQVITLIDGGTHHPCEQSVTATILKVKGKGWLMDQEEETFAENVEVKA